MYMASALLRASTATGPPYSSEMSKASLKSLRYRGEAARRFLAERKSLSNSCSLWTTWVIWISSVGARKSQNWAVWYAAKERPGALRGMDPPPGVALLGSPSEKASRGLWQLEQETVCPDKMGSKNRRCPSAATTVSMRSPGV